MISRLKTTNPDLADEITSASLADARAIVREILRERRVAMPAKAAELLPVSFEVQSYMVSQDQIDALDSDYFDSEEKGEVEQAAASFMAARFLAAVMLWQTASNHFELCEAAYEAHFAAEPNA